jgi:hypothetical protein
MADLEAIDDFMNDASLQAAAWYSILTQRPAVVPGTTPQTVTLQQQAGLLPPAPLATVLTSPSIAPLALLLGALVVLVFLLKE